MTFTAATMTRICLVSYDTDYVDVRLVSGVTRDKAERLRLYLQWRESNANRFPFEAPYSERRRGVESMK